MMYYLTMGQDEVSFRISSSNKPNDPQVNEAIKALLPPEWTQILEEQTIQIRTLIQARSMHLANCKATFTKMQESFTPELTPELFL